jgi:CubicO group peptidase (beta-lactamase class C family)
MHARLIGTVALLAAPLAVAACDDEPAPSAPAPAQTPVLDEGERLLRDLDLPEGSSGSLAAMVDGEVVACAGWGEADHESGSRAGCDTVYDVGSVTKQFTAAAVVKLESQGRLATTDPIGRWFDGVPRDKRGITVRHLLTHTAGLVDALGDDYDPLERDAMVAGALASELRSDPGSRYHYSNLGYSLLAAIVEEASGQDYETYLADQLFEPAGMTATGYLLPDWDERDVAIEYDARDRPQGRPFDHPWDTDGPYWNLRGNGGLLSTADDLGRWLAALEGDDVLDDAAKAELFRPRVREEPGGATRYAYGWVVAGSPLGPVDWHNGGNGWSYAEITRLPESGVSFFWVTNRYRSAADGWNLDQLRPSLTEQLAERLVDPG